jgi:hypothetical protein
MFVWFAARNLYDAAHQAFQEREARVEFADRGNAFVRFRAVGITKRTIDVTLFPSGDRACGAYLRAFEAEESAKRNELMERGYRFVQCGGLTEGISGSY